MYTAPLVLRGKSSATAFHATTPDYAADMGEGICVEPNDVREHPGLQFTERSARNGHSRHVSCTSRSNWINIQTVTCYLAVRGSPRLAFGTRRTSFVKASIQTLLNRAGRPSLRNRSGPAMS